MDHTTCSSISHSLKSVHNKLPTILEIYQSAADRIISEMILVKD